MLVKSNATTKALEDLKSLLIRYMSRVKDLNDASPLVSNLALDNPLALNSYIMQEGDKVLVETSLAIPNGGDKESCTV